MMASSSLSPIYQNHLLRLEQSLRSDNQPKSVVYELIQSWSAQAILLLLLGWLMLTPEHLSQTGLSRSHFGDDPPASSTAPTSAIPLQPKLSERLTPEGLAHPLFAHLLFLTDPAAA